MAKARLLRRKKATAPRKRQPGPKCKLKICKSTATAPCDGCGKPICSHHCSVGWHEGRPWCAKCRATGAIGRSPNPPLTPPGATARVRSFLKALHELTGHARRVFVEREWGQVFPDEDMPDADLKLVERRIAYELTWLGYREAGCLDLMPEKVLRRRIASAKMRADAYDEPMQEWFLLSKVAQDERREKRMAKGTKTKSKRSEGKTIGRLLVKLLSAKSEPDTEKLIAAVKAEFPESRFDSKHLAWYKGKFRKGELPGMDGKPTKIAGDDERAARRAAKGGKKKGTRKKAGSKKAATAKRTRKVRRKKASSE